MFKFVHHQVWAFDAEWVPDPVGGRVLYKLPPESSDREVLEEMWRQGGATPEDPMPFLKTVLCRIVSICMVSRKQRRDGEVIVGVHALPRHCHDPVETSEANVVGTFLNQLGERRPQLVGYNSNSADLKAMIQRGVINGLQATHFCKRPNKPWEGVDYFARGSDHNLDLKEFLSGWGRQTPSLNEMATLSGIPGKMEVDGNQVAELWLAGKLEEIVAYNEFDAFTTYLLWLRMAHFAGHFTPEQYRREQELVRQLLQREAEGERPHLARYLAEWDRLRSALNRS